MSEKEDLSTPEDISVKPKRCTACREPVKGHFGLLVTSAPINRTHTQRSGHMYAPQVILEPIVT